MSTNDKRCGKLEGKVALITGGTTGIGLATAKRFVSEGAFVFITARREEELAAAAREIGRNVAAIRGDVSKLSGRWLRAGLAVNVPRFNLTQYQIAYSLLRCVGERPPIDRP